MNPTSEQLETLFQTEKERELYRELESAEHDKIMAEIRVEELENILNDLRRQFNLEYIKNQELESTIRKFLNYARTGNSVNTYVPNWQIEELAESLNSPQTQPQDLPRTNPYPSPPQSQELPTSDSKTEF